MPCNKGKQLTHSKRVIAIVKSGKIISGPGGIQDLHHCITRVQKENTTIGEDDCKTILGKKKSCLTLISSMKSTEKINLTEMVQKVNLKIKKVNGTFRL